MIFDLHIHMRNILHYCYDELYLSPIITIAVSIMGAAAIVSLQCIVPCSVQVAFAQYTMLKVIEM